MSSKNRYLYNGKEVQREVFGGYPLGWYDYGARGLNSDFCRFMSVDPMAQMYYPISPYVYCLNNPIKFVDPDGRKVVVVGTASYTRKVVNDINQLRRDDKSVNRMIVDLINSPNTHVVEMPNKKKRGQSGEAGFNYTAYNEEKADGGIPQGSTIGYDPDNRETKRGDDRTPRVGLAHELKHSDQADQGKLNNKSVTDSDPQKSVKILEINAIKIENKIRKRTGDKKRTKYNGNEIPEKLLDD